jgi:hypothetical protein
MENGVESILVTYPDRARIGYVAVTGARDLLILGIPVHTSAAVIIDIKRKGFSEWV